MMPDPQFYKTCLEEAYEELRVAARNASPHVAASGNPKK
jgi:hypothetical protein|tara:strand:+ start:2988 stop:3104 length:117 start_codon:yes stop_codon:yes gene_type:complete